MMIIGALIERIKMIIWEEKKRLKFKKEGVIVSESATIGNDCSLGYGTYIGRFSHLDKTKVGRYTSIGDYCVIGPGEHRINKVSTCYRIYKNDYGIEYYDGDDSRLEGGVIIGNDVWIGCHSVLRRGIKVGNGAVVGACSFVNKDVPDFAVVAGVPAKIIRYRFDEETIGVINNSGWWDMDLAEARECIKELEEKNSREK